MGDTDWSSPPPHCRMTSAYIELLKRGKDILVFGLGMASEVDTLLGGLDHGGRRLGCKVAADWSRRTETCFNTIDCQIARRSYYRSITSLHLSLRLHLLIRVSFLQYVHGSRCAMHPCGAASRDSDTNVEWFLFLALSSPRCPPEIGVWIPIPFTETLADVAVHPWSQCVLSTLPRIHDCKVTSTQSLRVLSYSYAYNSEQQQSHSRTGPNVKASLRPLFHHVDIYLVLCFGSCLDSFYFRSRFPPRNRNFLW